MVANDKFCRLKQLTMRLDVVHRHTLQAQILHIYRVAPKNQKIVLKIANEIRFLRKVKVWIKHYNTIRW